MLSHFLFACVCLYKTIVNHCHEHKPKQKWPFSFCLFVPFLFFPFLSVFCVIILLLSVFLSFVFAMIYVRRCFRINICFHSFILFFLCFCCSFHNSFFPFFSVFFVYLSLQSIMTLLTLTKRVLDSSFSFLKMVSRTAGEKNYNIIILQRLHNCSTIVSVFVRHSVRFHETLNNFTTSHQSIQTPTVTLKPPFSLNLARNDCPISWLLRFENVIFL